MIFKKNTVHVISERVILTPAGFVDDRRSASLKNKEVRIIEIRSLGDGSLFYTLRRDPQNS
jgi:hypothetical protein